MQRFKSHRPAKINSAASPRPLKFVHHYSRSATESEQPHLDSAVQVGKYTDIGLILVNHIYLL